MANRLAITEEPQTNRLALEEEPVSQLALERPEPILREDLMDKFLMSDKSISEWLPTEQAEVAKGILESFDDPENTERRLTSAIMLSDMFDIELETMFTLQPAMMKQIFGDELVNISERFKKEPIEGGFFKKSIESIRYGNRPAVASQVGYDAQFLGIGDKEEALRIYRKIELNQMLHPIEGSFLAELFYSGLEVLPGMARGYWSAIPKAFTGMAVGASMGLAAGQIPPLTISIIEDLPLTAVGAVMGGKAGLMTGAAMFWYKQGAYSMFAAMEAKGYNEELSMHVAGVAAVPYAIVEFLQVSQLTPGLRRGALQVSQKSILRVLGEATKRYGATWTEEVFEEIVQEIIQVVAEDIAGFLSDELHLPEGLSNFLLKRGQRVWETTKAAGKAMALLPIPGAVIDVTTGTRSVVSQKRRAEINAKLKALIPPAEVTVPVTEPTPAELRAERPVVVPPEGEITPPEPSVKPEIGVKPVIAKEVIAEKPTEAVTEGKVAKATPVISNPEVAESAGVTKPDILSGVKTGKAVSVDVVRGSGRATKGEVYKSGEGEPAFGLARYSAIDETFAKHFGPKIENLTVQLNNPFVLTNDEQLANLVGRPVPRDGDPRKQFLKEAREKIESLGHDGIIINIPNFGDADTAGKSAKRLIEISGATQVVEFSPKPRPAAEVKAPVKRIITKETYEAAKKRLIDPTKLRIGLDPKDLADLATIGAYHFESGVRKFTDWSVKMTEELGERIKPHLKAIWDEISPAAAAVTEGKVTREEFEAIQKERAEMIAEETRITDKFATEIGEQLKNTGVRIKPTSIGILKANWRGHWIDNDNVFTFYTNKVIGKEERIELEKALPENVKVFPRNIDFPKTLVEARPAAEVEKVPEVKPEAKEAEAKKLHQKIHAVSAVKGLTKKTLSDLKLKHTGYRTLAGKVAVKKITIDQLQSLLAAVRKARPKTVEGRKVLTKKQENKIASLKENLIRLKHLTEVDYVDILQIETNGREAEYIDAKNFITQKEANAVIKRIHNTAEITRVVESGEAAIRSNTEVAQQVYTIDKTINDKRAVMKRDPWQFESMRHFNEAMELKTGAPFYAMYLDITKTHSELTKTRAARLEELNSKVPNFKNIAGDEKALERVSLYISSQSRLKTPVPVGITADEITAAKAIQDILKGYENKVRWTRFYWWYTTGQQTGPYPIGDYEQNKKEIGKAVDIYESKGKDAVIEYLNTQTWGIIKSGYEPLENVTKQKVRLYQPRPATVGKSHAVEIRTAVEYKKQERTILQRLPSYMRQIDMLHALSPKINAYIQLFEDNAHKFNNPARIKEAVENYMQTLKGYNVKTTIWGRGIKRAYSQAMRSIIMVNPVLAFRNLFQNLAFYHDKTNLTDPRNKVLSPKRIEFLETYVQQQRAMMEEWFMIGEKPLPGLKTITKLADKVKVYPWSDVTNRYWAFWAKVNQVDRSLGADTTAQMMKDAKFSDMTDFEQRMALTILARDGKDAMANFVAATTVADTQWQYQRSQRSPAEMGGEMSEIFGNLMLFSRAYGEKLTRQANKMIRGKDFEEQWRAAKVIMVVIAGGMLVGSIYKKITGRRRNPYNPLQILGWQVGGLAAGVVDQVNETYGNMMQAFAGDEKALARFLNSLPQAANMFIPFYDQTLRGIEALTDTKNIDFKAVRQIRAAIDKEYKIRGGAYKVKRDALEKWQYFIGGAGVDQKIKEGKKRKPIEIKG